MYITDSVFYVGVNDHEVDLFEGQYKVPNGMAYNSYVIRDERIAVLDTVDQGFAAQWLANVAEVLGDRKPDYLVIHHMEPDHAGSIAKFMEAYPETTIVSNAKAFVMMDNFFPGQLTGERMVVGEGGTLSLGSHCLTFVTA
ncbi:MAG: MBL fold metallo-hydrolase, partial [Oscillospiraceae bacterium]|nr:MBL fold metallo-hydrolase [Oscillospiraceae bacterium]